MMTWSFFKSSKRFWQSFITAVPALNPKNSCKTFACCVFFSLRLKIRVEQISTHALQTDYNCFPVLGDIPVQHPL